MFKVLDKLLFRRIWPTINAAVAPWHGGGELGADIMAWTVSELLATCRRQAPASPTYAAFVDGESAYCRPPAVMVMSALLLVAGLCSTDLLLIYKILTSLWGTACVLGGLHGAWKVETGLMQGGALSTALFVVLLILLQRDLYDKGCGIWLQHGARFKHIPLLGFIDDLLLLSDTPRGLQNSLDVVCRWARATRMRLNVAADKTAIMVISSAEAPVMRWHLGRGRVPVVAQYKYMGCLISANCCFGPLIGCVCKKIIDRTGELLRWARANHLTLDILNRM